MTETDATKMASNLYKQDWGAILNGFPMRAGDTGYTERLAGTGALDSVVLQWLIEVARLQVARQLQSVRADLETHESRIAVLEEQAESTGTETLPYLTMPLIQTQ